MDVLGGYPRYMGKDQHFSRRIIEKLSLLLLIVST